MKRVTITDVAKHARVSTGTVSAVLNGRTSVRDITRQRVLDVIDELGYQPSFPARNLRLGHTNDAVTGRCVGLLIKEIDNPFYTDVITGTHRLLQDQGYAAFVCTSQGNYEQEGDLINALRGWLIHGAIIAPVLHAQTDLSHLFMLKRARYPFVVLEDLAGLRVNSVSMDNVKASQMALRYLIESGHQRIVYLAGPTYTQCTRDRIQGVEPAFSPSNLVYSEAVIVPAGARSEDGYRATVQLFRDRSAEERPTAVACFNDLVAMGVLRALAELGLSVPEDVSVVGFDDIQEAAYLPVPLTTVRVPKLEMGRRAAELLLRQLDASEAMLAERVVLETDLVLRGSTRALS